MKSGSKHFQKYESKLKLEAFLKSLLCALAVGFGANFVTALTTWFLDFNGLWLSLAVLAGVTLASLPIFYLKRFRPTDLQSARRIDRLGLDERLITMVELDKEDSYIARMQREDAMRAMKRIESTQLKLKISKGITVALAICAILGLGMTTVTTLSVYGIVPGGDELIGGFIEDQTAVYVTVTYEIEEGGVIEGDEIQVIVLGTDATIVIAVPDEGYSFKCWSDGSENPVRIDTNVTEDLVFTAEFTPNGDEEGDGDGDGDGEPGDEPGDAPSDSDSDSDGNNNSDAPPSPNDGNGPMGGGASEPNDKVLDGETNYKDVLGDYQSSADEQISGEGSGLSEGEKDLAKKYLGIV